MKSPLDHIDTLRAKPHHVRKSVAFGAAAGVAAFIGVVWIGVSLATNAFAVPQSNFAEAMQQGSASPPVVNGATGETETSGLAGAAAATEGSPSASAPASLEVVDQSAPAAATSTPEQTTIPF